MKKLLLAGLLIAASLEVISCQEPRLTKAVSLTPSHTADQARAEVFDALNDKGKEELAKGIVRNNPEVRLNIVKEIGIFNTLGLVCKVTAKKAWQKTCDSAWTITKYSLYSAAGLATIIAIGAAGSALTQKADFGPAFTDAYSTLAKFTLNKMTLGACFAAQKICAASSGATGVIGAGGETVAQICNHGKK